MMRALPLTWRDATHKCSHAGSVFPSIGGVGCVSSDVVRDVRGRVAIICAACNFRLKRGTLPEVSPK